MTLTAEQTRVIDLVRSGRNVFLTGPPGTGKSHVVHTLIATLKQSKRAVKVVAPTGAAASLVGGKTIHSMFYMGTGNQTAENTVRAICKYRKKTSFLPGELDVLVVDEISMVGAKLLDLVDDVLGRLRGTSSKAFGGVQVVAVGDFSQLSPVGDEFCFKSDSWKYAQFVSVCLTKSFRQSGDEDFLRVLADTRNGTVGSHTLECLKQCMFREFPGDVKPTRVYSLRKQVDVINDVAMKDALRDGRESCVYPRKLFGRASARATLEAFARSLDVPDSITLAVGVQVVLTWNVSVDTGLINGTRGVVTAIGPVHVDVETTDGTTHKVVYVNVTPDASTNKSLGDCSVSFLPLRLGYAITVHRAQGMTLDCMEIDLGSSIFAAGQAYTALSRARSLDCVRLVNLSPSSFKASPEVQEFYQKLDCKTPSKTVV